jgi:broad specificity phosphatase PhoE
MLPLDIILVRHGQSEGNAALSAWRKGDPEPAGEHRDRHSREYRLTDKGIEQARMAGEWIRKHVYPSRSITKFLVSDYLRARETAAHLGLPGARWSVQYNLRERDMASMDNMSIPDRKKYFPLEDTQYAQDRFLSIPAGGGESIPRLCQRVKTESLDEWGRRFSQDGVIAVGHGHTMRAFQLVLEGLGHDDFIRLDTSEEPADLIRNCHILWYTRIHPGTHNRGDSISYVRSVSPTEGIDHGWQRITHPTYTDAELLAYVDQYPRHIS